ncbi:hypothetical protein [Aestuariimicrobium ganziense]|uniref:hypothetical protein n=1 Tax=Aestuariimicrobium ganziense TaxID=2773677 RepID=UPI001942AC55|nr:hypothetical protein [Aestuariimicrobium ganziense]
MFTRDSFAQASRTAASRFGGTTPSVSGIGTQVIGSRAFVNYTVTGSGASFSPQGEPWVREGTTWLVDACN